MKRGIEKSNILYEHEKKGLFFNSPSVVDPGLEPESPP